MKRLAMLVLLAIGLTPVDAKSARNAVEVGLVTWQRDLDAAFVKSAETGRPIFLLFQEVPGCSGCKEFGMHVLSHPLLVEAIEDEFIPVLVYNNRKGGMDEKLLKRFKEPAWNYQVVRFLDAKGRDIIPRKDRVWTISGIASRAIKVLEVSKRPVPKYLKVVAAENDTENQGVSAFAMSCFWTGEYELGKIEGVVSTEAGWLEGHEVTRVVYLKNVITLEGLAEKARKKKCARKVYAPGKEAKALKAFTTGELSSEYRKARASDQKKQISRWQAIHRVPGLTPMQLTKINAFAPIGKGKALEWLSPRQRKALEKIEEAL